MPTTHTTDFVPSVHGFRFGNDFRHDIVGRVFESWGSCNGMAHCALDCFHAGRTVPRTANVNFNLPLESGRAAAIMPDGTVQLLALRAGPFGNAIAGKVVREHGASTWGECVAGQPAFTPAIACWGPDRTDVIAVGGDQQVYHCGVNGPPLAGRRRDCSGRLSHFTLLGGRTDRQPALAAPFPNRLEVYAVGIDDDSLYFRWWDGRWSEWVGLGRPPSGPITSGPAAVAHHGFMAVYARGADNEIWERVWRDGDFGPWTSLGGQFTSGPAAATPFPGRVEVYGRGQDGAIWLNVFDQDHWGWWSSLGGPPAGTREETPAAVSRYGLLDVYARAADRTMWHRRWVHGGWQEWASVETEVPADSTRLTDAIFERMMASTQRPVIAALATLGIALPALGAKANYVTWRSPATETTFHWTVTDELRKLIGFLKARRPIPLGLIGFNGWGHEVVAFGLESESDLPPDSFELPGDFRYSTNVYDPKYPGCDNVRISFDGRDRRPPINQENPAIRSSTGETWRGCFVRDDYQPEPPPL